jgi:hypothetical protein
MITLQRSNPTVTQILAAHGCQTTALQDRYDIHTLAPLVFSSACLQLRLATHCPMIIIQIFEVVCLCARAGGG